MLKKEDVKKDSVLVCLDNFEYFTKDKEYKVLHEKGTWNEYYRVNDDIDVLRCLFDHGFDRLHMFKLKEETSMLKIEDIKEGDVLICINNVPCNITAYKVGTEYKVIKQDNGLYIDRLTHKHSEYNLRVAALTLTNFKLKQKETTMLDPEIFAVGTIHKSVNGMHEYTILARDIKTPEYKSGVCMLMYEINPIDDTQATHTVDQSTGKAFNDDSEDHCLDLAITKKKIKGWINIKTRDKVTYKWRQSYMYDTKEQAINDRPNPNEYIACIEVEFEEGEGL